jgi:hypothetical protein
LQAQFFSSHGQLSAYRGRSNIADNLSPANRKKPELAMQKSHYCPVSHKDSSRPSCRDLAGNGKQAACLRAIKFCSACAESVRISLRKTLTFPAIEALRQWLAWRKTYRTLDLRSFELRLQSA